PPLYQGAFISGVTPSQFSPDGGQIFTILGGGFRTPVRVFLDLGDGATPLEVFVVSLTTTAIEVVTPKVDVAPRGWRSASVMVVSEAGGASETRATARDTIRFVAFDIA